jgi:hypothetical protein
MPVRAVDAAVRHVSVLSVMGLKLRNKRRADCEVALRFSSS